LATNSTDPKKTDVEWKWKRNYEPGKLQAMTFKLIAYRTKDIKGKTVVGQGKTDFVDEKHKKKHEMKVLNFDKFTHNATKKETTIKNTIFENKEEVYDDDPIKYDNTDSKYFFDNEEAISVTINKKKKNN